MNASSARPPATPTATPTAICRANSATTCQATLAAPPCAASRADSSAIPTGSLAPDSPSSSTPVRPAISRRPNTENTTAGSVAATAVPTSSARCQPMPATKCAATVVPAAVTTVPAIPVQTMAPAAVRNRCRPMCRPPSNKMIASATVTTRSTVVAGSTVPAEESAADGHSWAAITAATRKNAGAGTRSRALSRLESTAAVPARPITAMMSPNWLVPAMDPDPTGLRPGGRERGEVEGGRRQQHVLHVVRVRQQAELVHDVGHPLQPGLVDADGVGVEGHHRRDLRRHLAVGRPALDVLE